MSSTSSRVAAAESRLRVLRPGLREIVIRGGLTPGVDDNLATIDGKRIEREPDETTEALRARARESAINANAKVCVFGGLSGWNTDGSRGLQR